MRKKITDRGADSGQHDEDRIGQSAHARGPLAQQSPVAGIVDRIENILFASEYRVHRPQRQPRLTHDVVHRGGIESLVGEHTFGRFQKSGDDAVLYGLVALPPCERAPVGATHAQQRDWRR